MSLETKIREAFEHHEIDVSPVAGSWTAVEDRIRRSHRRRVIASGLGAALAIVAAALGVPRTLDRLPEPPITPNGWKAIASTSGGFELSYPPTWIATEADRSVQVTPPGPPQGPEGKLSFSLNAFVSDTPYDNPDVTKGTRTTGEIEGHPFVRYEIAGRQDALNRYQIVYLIEWEGPPARCPSGEPCAQPAYELQISITGRFPNEWERYSPTAERIVRTAHAIPAEAAPPVPQLQARIKVEAAFLASGADAIWAITQRSGGEGAFLSKIDPATNRVVGTVDVGLAPVGVAADGNGVWVANGSGCAISYGCSQGGEGPPPTPQFPREESVWRIDPVTMKVVARIRVAGPSDIAAGHEGVWVASYGDGHGSSLVSRIDPSTNEISRRVTIEGDGPLAVATGEGDVWAVSHAPGSEGSTGILSVIDPVGGRVVVSSRFGSGQSVDVAAGLGSAWVMAAGSDTSDRAILRTDDAKKIDLMIRIDDASPVPLYAATAGEGFVWVTGGRGVLWKIDPNKNAVVGDNVMIGDNPPVGSGVVVTGFGSVWVASGDGQIWRLAP